MITVSWVTPIVLLDSLQDLQYPTLKGFCVLHLLSKPQGLSFLACGMPIRPVLAVCSPCKNHIVYDLSIVDLFSDLWDYVGNSFSHSPSPTYYFVVSQYFQFLLILRDMEFGRKTGLLNQQSFSPTKYLPKSSQDGNSYLPLLSSWEDYPYCCFNFPTKSNHNSPF